MTTNLFLRDDTLLGVCEGLGEEFGFNPNYLRVGLAALLLWNAAVIVGVYLALGVVLAIGRWWWPASGSIAPSMEAGASTPVAVNDTAAVTLTRAA